MTTMRQLFRAQVKELGPREVEVVISTSAVARDGHVLVPQGCILDNYRANPIVLWSHDPEHPVGNADNIVVGQDNITARIVFAPEGVSRKADEICGLMKAGVLRAVSVGFDPLDGEPLDPKRPRGGQRFTLWELLEFSPVSVPADTGALVTARSADALFDDPTLPMDADGVPTAERAKPVTKPAAQPRARANAARAGKLTFTRGLYQVCELICLFKELGWVVDEARWEAEYEGDGSKVPDMLASVLQDLATAVLAMTKEEVAEALADRDLELEIDAGDVVLTVEERAHIAAAASPRARAFRRALARTNLRAGKTLSADTVRCLREALDQHQEGLDQAKTAMRCHRDAMGKINDLMDRAGVTDQADDAAEANAADVPVDEKEDGERAADADYRARQADVLALAAL